MSKKNRKKSTPRLSPAQLYRPGMATTPTAKAEEETPDVLPTAANVPSEETLAAEYQYVISDLKRIGVLALVMLVLLIVLAFVLI
jgi:hypothetical protein